MTDDRIKSHFITPPTPMEKRMHGSPLPLRVKMCPGQRMPEEIADVSAWTGTPSPTEKGLTKATLTSPQGSHLQTE